MVLSLAKALTRSAAFRVRSAMGMTIRPMKLRLAVTGRCNSRCRMCSVWKTDGDASKELALEEYERIFSASAGVFSALRHASVTGGEPLLREDVGEIVRLVHRRFPSVSLNFNTNGFRTEKLLPLARGLAEEGVCVAYNVSLDALNEVHDRMRGVPRASQMALRSIAGLRDLRDGGLRLKVNVNFTMTEDNAGEAARVFDFCRDNRMEFNPIMPVFGELYRNEGIDLSLSERARALLVDFFEKRLGDRNGSALAYSVVLDQLRGQAREFRCWAGQVILLVKENGDVYPNGGCPPGWLLGNLRTSGYDMKRLLESDRARLVRARIRRCRACRLPCETLTTLKYPEAYHAYRKTKQLRAARRRSA